jgi:hypothetical protein
VQHLLLHPCRLRLAVIVGVSMEWTTYLELKDAVRPCRPGETPPCYCPNGYRLLEQGSFDFELAGDVIRTGCSTNWTNDGLPARWSFNHNLTRYRNWSACDPPYAFDPCASHGWNSYEHAQGDGLGGSIKVGCCTELGGGISHCVACDPDGLIIPMWEVDARTSFSVPSVAYGWKSIRWNCQDEIETFEFAAGLDYGVGVRAYKPRFCGSIAKSPWGLFGGCNGVSTRFDEDVAYGTSIMEQGEWVPESPISRPRLGSTTGFEFIGPPDTCEPKPTTGSTRTWGIYQGPVAMIHRIGTKRIQCNVVPVQ